MLTLAVLDAEYAEPGTEVTFVWGEEHGGTSKPTVEPHVQRELRAIVSPVPYVEAVRSGYAPDSWRSARHVSRALTTGSRRGSRPRATGSPRPRSDTARSARTARSSCRAGARRRFAAGGWHRSRAPPPRSGRTRSRAPATASVAPWVSSGTIRPTPIATADAPIPVRHHASHVRSAASHVRRVTSEFCGEVGLASGAIGRSLCHMGLGRRAFEVAPGGEARAHLDRPDRAGRAGLQRDPDREHEDAGDRAGPSSRASGCRGVRAGRAACTPWRRSLPRPRSSSACRACDCFGFPPISRAGTAT